MPVIRDDAKLREILSEARVIAVVGYSNKPERPSNEVAHFLKDAGYHVIAINPMLEQDAGMTVYPSLDAVPELIDIVDVFRQPDALPGIVGEAAAVGAKVVWAQEGVVNEAAIPLAEEAGLLLVMDRCTKKEYKRLIGR